jgi:peroxiredoxin (alkyl hydroperoxide reductase subunit C)
MAWTFVCPTEIIAFSDRAADFAARGASVVFASTDSEYSLLAWTNASRKDGGLGPIKIPLLSDKNHQLSKDYGVLIEEEGIALRGLFVIDPNGVVRQVCATRALDCWDISLCDRCCLFAALSSRWCLMFS